MVKRLIRYAHGHKHASRVIARTKVAAVPVAAVPVSAVPVSAVQVAAVPVSAVYIASIVFARIVQIPDLFPRKLPNNNDLIRCGFISFFRDLPDCFNLANSATAQIVIPCTSAILSQKWKPRLQTEGGSSIS